MRIRDVLQAKSSQDVITITPDAERPRPDRALAEHNVGALIVSADGTAVDGIVSERDVVRHLHSDGTVDQRPWSGDHDHRGRDLRRRHPARRPDEDDDRASDPSRPRRHRRDLVGIISIGDVVKHRIDQLEFERDQLDSYVHQT